MIKFFSDKKGIWDKKIITIILVILVIASVLLALYKFDILKYFRLLPDFG